MEHIGGQSNPKTVEHTIQWSDVKRQWSRQGSGLSTSEPKSKGDEGVRGWKRSTCLLSQGWVLKCSVGQENAVGEITGMLGKTTYEIMPQEH